MFRVWASSGTTGWFTLSHIFHIFTPDKIRIAKWVKWPRWDVTCPALLVVEGMNETDWNIWELVNQFSHLLGKREKKRLNGSLQTPPDFHSRSEKLAGFSGITRRRLFSELSCQGRRNNNLCELCRSEGWNVNRVKLHQVCRGGSRGEEDALEGLPLIQPSGMLVGVGCSFSNDSHLSKLWTMQPQHSPVSSIPLGGVGGGASASQHTWTDFFWYEAED